jgi:tetratricopeptide (TPR) repeat protein
VAIKEKLGDEHGASSTYHQLGIIAEERGDFEEARKWYQKSVAIWEKSGDEHGASSTYGQLGLLAEEEGDILKAGEWLIKSILGFVKNNDTGGAQQGVGNFVRMYNGAEEDLRKRLKVIWEDGGFGDIEKIL